MTLWALSRRDNLADAWALMRCAERDAARDDGQRTMSALCYGALLMECEQRGLLSREVALLRKLPAAQAIEGISSSEGGGETDQVTEASFRAAAMNAAAVRLMAVDKGDDAAATLEDASANGQSNAASLGLLAACGGDVRARPKSMLRPSDIPPGAPYSKELRLLAHVLATARAGDASSVCQAMEGFGQEVLNAEGRWLKIAGNTKAEVLTAAVRRSPAAGSILEIGTYCGYSALRMSMAKPGARVVTLEVDPAHMVIARNIVAYAGRAHLIDVWTGHSKDLLHRLQARYPGETLTFSTVFMDQRGSRYDEDLAALEDLGLLKPGAVVVADNVLKPGSPYFLWRLVMSGSYDTHIVRLQEFAMPSEDWMSVSTRRQHETYEAADNTEGGNEICTRPLSPVMVPDHPPDLVQLQWESDRMRTQATRPGQGVTYTQWAAFAEHMKERFASLGIVATIDGSDLSELESSGASTAAEAAEEHLM